MPRTASGSWVCAVRSTSPMVVAQHKMGLHAVLLYASPRVLYVALSRIHPVHSASFMYGEGRPSDFSVVARPNLVACTFNSGGGDTFAGWVTLIKSRPFLWYMDSQEGFHLVGILCACISIVIGRRGACIWIFSFPSTRWPN